MSPGDTIKWLDSFADDWTVNEKIDLIEVILNSNKGLTIENIDDLKRVYNALLAEKILLVDD